ncbi:hypothetical protein QFC24_006817 [Naganishia onofrii]|uniref:Uncharacterized protein n=1 Tax=Naganishia onofrii TaxID=1851511 RepID=A0ACC2WXS7_9TREE|nr:hypothetical protein QFC24_006817 [Naganishia onofrii]
MPCAGDSSQICGQAYRLNVYSLGDSSTAPTTSAPATKSSTSTTPTPTTAQTTSTTSAAATGTATALGCYIDSGTARTLPDASSSSSSMTPTLCQSTCRSQGYIYAGASYGRECWCSSDAPSASAKTSDSDCSMPCAGDAKSICGNSYRLNIWRLSGVTTSAPVATSTTRSVSAAPASTTKVTTTSKVPTSTTSSAPTYTPTVGSTCIASDSREKKVWAHHIVGNTYPYTQADWKTDIQLAQANGIDGFALNFGLDPWQPARIADAYAVAAQLGSSFKLFLSPDMDVIECVSAANLGLIQNYITTYTNHSAAAKYGGKPLLSSFAGQNCRFGQSTMTAGWTLAMAGLRNSTYFIPAWTDNGDGFSQMSSYDMDGFVNWGAAWPQSTTDITMANDKNIMSLLGTRRLVATVSPLFYTHFSYKNWLYRSDDFMMSQKLEQLLCMRNQIDQIEIISWNDYGEAHYVGPIGGDQPPESKLYTLGSKQSTLFCLEMFTDESWLSSSVPHSDILPLIKYYATAWKTGSFPKITTDQVFVMARPHSAMTTATSDSFGAPTGRDRTQDNFYAQVHLTAPATVYMKTDSKTTTYNGVAGVNRFEAPLESGSGVEVLVGRNGQSTTSVVIPDYTFSNSTARYNFSKYAFRLALQDRTDRLDVF